MFFEAAIFIGLIAVIRPIYLAAKFYGIDRLGSAVAYMFLGEAWGMMVTLTFGTLAYFSMLSTMPEWASWVMRMLIFLPAIATSNHLGAVCKELRDKDGKGS